MAFITLAGTLLDPTSELAVGDQVRFTHKSTTGETIQSAVSLLTIPPTGDYSIDLQFGLVLVEYKDVRKSQFKNLGVATVNGTNPATSIPELLNALVPVSSAELIEFQAILADCVAEADRAEDAADVSEAFANQLTTAVLIASSAIYALDVNITTKGFTVSGDGGHGSWVQNGVTGQTASQSPTQLGDNLLNDANGNQWALVVGHVSDYNGTQWYPSPFGDSGNGGYLFDTNGWVYISLINDLSQAYEFPTVAAFKASLQVFLIGKTIEVLVDRYTVTTQVQHRIDIGDPSWVPDGTRDFYITGGVIYVAIKQGIRLLHQKERLLSLIASGELVFTTMGDSTEAGAGAGGGTYAQISEERNNGWMNFVFYYMMRNDTNFIPLNGESSLIHNAYKSTPGSVSLLSLPYPTWQATKVIAPTIEFIGNNANKLLTDKFTIYLNERTADEACTFDINIFDAKTDAPLFSGNLDSFTGQETFGVVGSFDVEGRVSKRVVTMPATPRSVRVVLDNFQTIDRGAGVSADGDVAFFGSSFGSGLEYHNLAVSSTTLLEGSAANISRGVDTSERLALAQSFSSNAYLIGFSSNDSKVGVSNIEDFRSQYIQLIEDILATEPNAVIMLSNDPRGKIPSIYEFNPPFNSVVRGLASEYGLILMDAEKLSDTMSADFYFDDVHPSDQGTFQMVSSFTNILGLDQTSLVESTSSESVVKVGEFTIPDATAIPVGLAAVFSETITVPPGVSRLKLSAKITVKDATNSNLNTSAELKINGATFDASRVAIVSASGVSRLPIILEKVYDFGSLPEYTISINMNDNTGNGTTVVEARAVVTFQWV